MTKISVIVPIFNREDYLPACLESIINQTLNDIEIICINDGSTDNSINILREYASKDNRIIIIDKQNEGLSKSRNVGIDVAKGEYIGFCDSDDTIDLDFYEKLYNAAIKYDADIACASIYRTDKNKYLLKIKKEKIYAKLSGKYIAADLPSCCYVWNKIYKTEKIKQYNCYFKEGIYYEDMPWTFRTFYLLDKIVTVPKTRYYYEINPSSIVQEYSPKHKKDFFESINYIQDFVYKYNIKTSIKSWKNKHIECSRIEIFGINIIKIEDYKFAKCFYLFGKILIFKIKKNLNYRLPINPKYIE